MADQKLLVSTAGFSVEEYVALAWKRGYAWEGMPGILRRRFPTLPKAQIDQIVQAYREGKQKQQQIRNQLEQVQKQQQ